MRDLDAETLPVGQILSEKIFLRVPDYQRPFSWDPDNFEDLINDLVGADFDQQYFLGTTVLHYKEKDQIYDIVDGQQRITSLIILMACLRDLVDDGKIKSNLQKKIMQEENFVDGIPQKIRLEVRDSSIFNDLVVVQDGTSIDHAVSKLSEPHWRYIQAASIFRGALESFTQEKLQNFIQFVSQKCILIKLSTYSFADAFRLFSIVNDRGKQLRRIDILKAQNLGPEYIQSDSVRAQLAHRWQQYENELGSDRFESVFFLARLIYVKEKPQGDLLKEFEERIFVKNLQKGQQFFEVMFRYADLYEQIFIDRDIADVDDQKNYKFRNLIQIMISEYQASEWQACLLYYVQKFGKKDILTFLYRLEKIYLEQWVQGTRKDERFKKYADILTVIQAASNSGEVIPKIVYDAEIIRNGVKDSNLYNLGYKKYVLLRLELLCSEQDQIRFFEAKSIEHVLPQNPSQDSEWLNQHDKEDMKNYVNSLGNLVLISKSKNSSASNKEFSDKKKTYLSPRVSDYPRSNQILGYNEWSKKDITERTNEAANIFLDDL